jgi:hypothetical protein
MGTPFSLLMPQHHAKRHTMGIMPAFPKSVGTDKQQHMRERMCDTMLLNEAIS